MTHHGIVSDDDDVDLTQPISHGPRLSSIAKATVVKHLPGQHDQLSHGRKGPGSGKPHQTIPNTGAQTPYDKIPDRYKASMAKRMAKMGLTPDMLQDQVRAALDRGDPKHAAWYDEVHGAVTTMAARHGTSVEAAAGAVAALSPAREFGKNMRDAEKLLGVLSKDEMFTPSDDAVAMYNKKNPKTPVAKGESYRPSDLDHGAVVGLHPVLSKLGNNTGLDGAERATRIYRGETPDAILGGPKVRSFYDNIVDPRGAQGQEVTIDTWMYRTMTPPGHKYPNYGGQTLAGMERNQLHKLNDEPFEGSAKRAQDVYQGSPSALKGIDMPAGVGVYPEFAEAVRVVAAERGITPAGAQAIVWEVARVDAGYKATNMEEVLGPWR